MQRINEALKRELESPRLSKLEYGSYEHIVEDAMSELEHVQAPLTRDELKRGMLNLLRILMELRVRKALIALVEGDLDPGTLLEEERALLGPLMALAHRPETTAHEERVFVVLGSRISRVVTSDLARVGPLERGDVAVVPREDSERLAREGNGVVIRGPKLV